MATSISISSASSAGTAFYSMVSATEFLENWLSQVRSASFNTAATSLGESSSQVTVSLGGSQHTVHVGEHAQGAEPESSTTEAASSAQRGSIGSNDEKRKERPTYGGLPQDSEGKETRKAMLARRRQECAVDEVDVALAPVMKVQVPYCFYPEQYRRFRMMFPRVNVDSGLSYTHHDHPVAHTATLVGIRRMQAMFEPGDLVLDLHGNPNGNEQYNRYQSSRLKKRPHLPEPPVVDTLVEELVASDAVRRVTKWGPEFKDGLRRYLKMPIDDVPGGKYNVFTSVHTLYYYSMYQVNKLLAKNKGAKFIALVNYSPEQSGNLYGELRYSKDGGMTHQVSPNGEKYHHPDIDSWFQTNSFRAHTQTLGCGIAWTSTNIGGPLYLLTVTSCDWNLARPHKYEPPSAPTLRVSEGRSLFGLVKIGGSIVRLSITNHDLASELRHWMTFRDRDNPDTFLDLCVKARRVTSSDDIKDARQHVVGDGELQEHIIYAYLVDAPGELELLEGVKLLRGDLLKPLSDSLKLQGELNKDSILRAMTSWLVGRKKPMEALGHRSTSVETGMKLNSGGLLPTYRT